MRHIITYSLSARRRWLLIFIACQIRREISTIPTMAANPSQIGCEAKTYQTSSYQGK
nr:hypothetical protein [Proteus mirabilis]